MFLPDEKTNPPPQKKTLQFFLWCSTNPIAISHQFVFSSEKERLNLFHTKSETKIGDILIDWIQRTYSTSKLFFLFKIYFITSNFTRRFSLKKIFL